MSERKNISVLLTDTHLFERGTKKDAIIETNYEEVYKSFKKSIKVAKENNLPHVIHAGDFFDSRKHQSQNLLMLAYDILELFRESGIILILVTGNHDKTDYRSDFSFLSVFKDHPNLTLIERTHHFDDDENKVRFHFISYFDNDLYLEVLNEQLMKLHKNYKNVLVTHIGVSGVIANSGEKTEASIKISHFKDFDKVLIGHYHNYSSHSKDRIVYFGSALQHNFGEDNNKGVVLLNDKLNLQRVRTEFKEYRNIEVDVSEITQSELDELAKDDTNEYKRLILTGDINLIKALDRTKLIESGVKVDVKAEVIEVQKIEQKIESHSLDSIQEEFKVFCDNNSYDKEEGLSHLLKII